MNSEFKGKRLLVLGGTSGMGLAIARQVMRGGGSAVVTGRRADKAQEALAELSTLGPAWAITAVPGTHRIRLRPVPGAQQVLLLHHASRRSADGGTQAAWCHCQHRFDVGQTGHRGHAFVGVLDGQGRAALVDATPGHGTRTPSNSCQRCLARRGGHETGTR